MLRNHYRDIDVYEFTPASFGDEPSYVLKKTFKGLIQAPKNSRFPNNGKDGQTVDAVLFCDIGNDFKPKDKIKDPVSGQEYFISGYNSQPLGISGVTPSSGQHAEHNLVYDGDYNG